MTPAHRRWTSRPRPPRPGRLPLAALLAALALVAVACDRGSDADTVADIATDAGVTEAPCPEAVNPDNGCIYLGQLSDLSGGPFATLAVPITEGVNAFWRRVNEEGGIGGFDIDAETYIRDNGYDPDVHVAAYDDIEPSILALAQSLGTPPTLATLDRYQDDDVVGVAVTWWSGWEFEDVMLTSGYNYCLESMNGVDWAIETYGIDSVMSVHFPGDYGEDAMEGVGIAAALNDLDLKPAVVTRASEAAGDQDPIVEAILREQPDLVLIATGPRELSQIVNEAVALGYEGRFLGSVPTFHPALVEGDPGPAVTAHTHFLTPWAPWGADTPAHRAMQEAIGEGNVPENDGFTFGWMASYALKAAIERAIDSGDLTRSGLRQAVLEVSVDYEGALPDKVYDGDPDDTVVRSAMIAEPDPEAPLGWSVLEDSFVGQTAQQFDFTEPCTPPG